jgi:hypothetical protein
MGFGGTYLETTGQLAPISKYAEEKMYLALAQQAGVPVTDADMNDVSLSIMNSLRRLSSLAIGDGSPNDGYQIDAAGSPANNFAVKGGDGTQDGAGRLFVDGWPLLLLSDNDYTANQPLLHPRITRISTNANPDDTLEDDAANWGVNALVGRTLCPDITAPGTTYTISSNTATTITVSTTMAGPPSAGDYYRVNLSTPGAPRTDKVYVDVFLDEITEADDSDLGHSIGAPPANTECARRVRLRGIVRVVEGGTHGGNYTDLDGQDHWIYLLATLSRTAAANITAGMIADERRPIGSLDAAQESSIDPTFQIVSTTDITTAVDPPDYTGDFHTIYHVTATDDTRRIDYMYQGQLGSGHSTLEWVKIPLWGDGSYRIYVYAEGTGQVYDSGSQSTPASRTIVSVTRFMMTAQPTGEGHFIVKIEASLDNTEEFKAGALLARHF